ncbi:conserved Plasmodium protein, unknown function [Plasmodium ovale curtisi]|uniref:Uncharacterized protein n=1 Tax=Plasmodium ovale curtisi TaxID=864141 RepID=A0A1A8VSI2_PLAOA|nr:conserved Plasmodium protein, unknown function [Plasmodium ovale curtisi]
MIYITSLRNNDFYFKQYDIESLLDIVNRKNPFLSNSFVSTNFLCRQNKYKRNHADSYATSLRNTNYLCSRAYNRSKRKDNISYKKKKNESNDNFIKNNDNFIKSLNDCKYCTIHFYKNTSNKYIYKIREEKKITFRCIKLNKSIKLLHNKNLKISTTERKANNSFCGICWTKNEKKGIEKIYSIKVGKTTNGVSKKSLINTIESGTSSQTRVVKLKTLEGRNKRHFSNKLKHTNEHTYLGLTDKKNIVRSKNCINKQDDIWNEEFSRNICNILNIHTVYANYIKKVNITGRSIYKRNLKTIRKNIIEKRRHNKFEGRVRSNIKIQNKKEQLLVRKGEINYVLRRDIYVNNTFSTKRAFIVPHECPTGLCVPINSYWINVQDIKGRRKIHFSFLNCIRYLPPYYNAFSSYFELRKNHHEGETRCVICLFNFRYILCNIVAKIGSVRKRIYGGMSRKTCSTLNRAYRRVIFLKILSPRLNGSSLAQIRRVICIHFYVTKRGQNDYFLNAVDYDYHRLFFLLANFCVIITIVLLCSYFNIHHSQSFLYMQGLLKNFFAEGNQVILFFLIIIMMTTNKPIGVATRPPIHDTREKAQEDFATFLKKKVRITLQDNISRCCKHSLDLYKCIFFICCKKNLFFLSIFEIKKILSRNASNWGEIKKLKKLRMVLLLSSKYYIKLVNYHKKKLSKWLSILTRANVNLEMETPSEGYRNNCKGKINSHAEHYLNSNEHCNEIKFSFLLELLKKLKRKKSNIKLSERRRKDIKGSILCNLQKKQVDYNEENKRDIIYSFNICINYRHAIHKCLYSLPTNVEKITNDIFVTVLFKLDHLVQHSCSSVREKNPLEKSTHNADVSSHSRMNHVGKLCTHETMLEQLFSEEMNKECIIDLSISTAKHIYSHFLSHNLFIELCLILIHLDKKRGEHKLLKGMKQKPLDTFSEISIMIKHIQEKQFFLPRGESVFSTVLLNLVMYHYIINNSVDNQNSATKDALNSKIFSHSENDRVDVTTGASSYGHISACSFPANYAIYNRTITMLQNWGNGRTCNSCSYGSFHATKVSTNSTCCNRKRINNAGNTPDNYTVHEKNGLQHHNQYKHLNDEFMILREKQKINILAKKYMNYTVCKILQNYFVSFLNEGLNHDGVKERCKALKHLDVNYNHLTGKDNRTGCAIQSRIQGENIGKKDSTSVKSLYIKKKIFYAKIRNHSYRKFYNQFCNYFYKVCNHLCNDLASKNHTGKRNYGRTNMSDYFSIPKINTHCNQIFRKKYGNPSILYNNRNNMNDINYGVKGSMKPLHVKDNNILFLHFKKRAFYFHFKRKNNNVKGNKIYNNHMNDINTYETYIAKIKLQNKRYMYRHIYHKNNENYKNRDVYNYYNSNCRNYMNRYTYMETHSKGNISFHKFVHNNVSKLQKGRKVVLLNVVGNIKHGKMFYDNIRIGKSNTASCRNQRKNSSKRDGDNFTRKKRNGNNCSYGNICRCYNNYWYRNEQSTKLNALEISYAISHQGETKIEKPLLPPCLAQNRVGHFSRFDRRRAIHLNNNRRNFYLSLFSKNKRKDNRYDNYQTEENACRIVMIKRKHNFCNFLPCVKWHTKDKICSVPKHNHTDRIDNYLEKFFSCKLNRNMINRGGGTIHINELFRKYHVRLIYPSTNAMGANMENKCTSRRYQRIIVHTNKPCINKISISNGKQDNICDRASCNKSNRSNRGKRSNYGSNGGSNERSNERSNGRSSGGRSSSGGDGEGGNGSHRKNCNNGKCDKSKKTKKSKKRRNSLISCKHKSIKKRCINNSKSVKDKKKKTGQLMKCESRKEEKIRCNKEGKGTKNINTNVKKEEIENTNIDTKEGDEENLTHNCTSFKKYLEYLKNLDYDIKFGNVYVKLKKKLSSQNKCQFEVYEAEIVAVDNISNFLCPYIKNFENLYFLLKKNINNYDFLKTDTKNFDRNSYININMNNIVDFIENMDDYNLIMNHLIINQFYPNGDSKYNSEMRRHSDNLLKRKISFPHTNLSEGTSSTRLLCKEPIHPEEGEKREAKFGASPMLRETDGKINGKRAREGTRASSRNGSNGSSCRMYTSRIVNMNKSAGASGIATAENKDISNDVDSSINPHLVNSLLSKFDTLGKETNVANEHSVNNKRYSVIKKEGESFFIEKDNNNGIIEKNISKYGHVSSTTNNDSKRYSDRNARLVQFKNYHYFSTNKYDINYSRIFAYDNLLRNKHLFINNLIEVIKKINFFQYFGYKSLYDILKEEYIKYCIGKKDEESNTVYNILKHVSVYSYINDVLNNPFTIYQNSVTNMRSNKFAIKILNINTCNIHKLKYKIHSLLSEGKQLKNVNMEIINYKRRYYMLDNMGMKYHNNINGTDFPKIKKDYNNFQKWKAIVKLNIDEMHEHYIKLCKENNSIMNSKDVQICLREICNIKSMLGDNFFNRSNSPKNFYNDPLFGYHHDDDTEKGANAVVTADAGAVAGTVTDTSSECGNQSARPTLSTGAENELSNKEKGYVFPFACKYCLNIFYDNNTTLLEEQDRKVSNGSTISMSGGANIQSVLLPNDTIKMEKSPGENLNNVILMCNADNERMERGSIRKSRKEKDQIVAKGMSVRRVNINRSCSGILRRRRIGSITSSQTRYHFKKGGANKKEVNRSLRKKETILKLKNNTINRNRRAINLKREMITKKKIVNNSAIEPMNERENQQNIRVLPSYLSKRNISPFESSSKTGKEPTCCKEITHNFPSYSSTIQNYAPYNYLYNDYVAYNHFNINTSSFKELKINICKDCEDKHLRHSNGKSKEIKEKKNSNAVPTYLWSSIGITKKNENVLGVAMQMIEGCTLTYIIQKLKWTETVKYGLFLLDICKKLVKRLMLICETIDNPIINWDTKPGNIMVEYELVNSKISCKNVTVIDMGDALPGKCFYFPTNPTYYEKIKTNNIQSNFNNFLYYVICTKGYCSPECALLVFLLSSLNKSDQFRKTWYGPDSNIYHINKTKQLRIKYRWKKLLDLRFIQPVVKKKEIAIYDKWSNGGLHRCSCDYGSDNNCSTSGNKQDGYNNNGDDNSGKYEKDINEVSHVNNGSANCSCNFSDSSNKTAYFEKKNNDSHLMYSSRSTRQGGNSNMHGSQSHFRTMNISKDGQCGVNDFAKQPICMINTNANHAPSSENSSKKQNDSNTVFEKEINLNEKNKLEEYEKDILKDYYLTKVCTHDIADDNSKENYTDSNEIKEYINNKDEEVKEMEIKLNKCDKKEKKKKEYEYYQMHPVDTWIIKFTTKTTIFSVGLVLCQLFGGQNLLNVVNKNEVKVVDVLCEWNCKNSTNIYSGEKNITIDDLLPIKGIFSNAFWKKKIKKIVKKCLQFIPSRRCTFEELYNDLKKLKKEFEVRHNINNA